MGGNPENYEWDASGEDGGAPSLSYDPSGGVKWCAKSGRREAPMAGRHEVRMRAAGRLASKQNANSK